MSRGPGVWQRRILAALDDNNLVVLTKRDDSKSVQNAIRRAAYRLEELGLIELTSVPLGGVARLAACKPGQGAPEPRFITGMDGKQYRRPPSRWVAAAIRAELDDEAQRQGATG